MIFHKNVRLVKKNFPCFIFLVYNMQMVSGFDTVTINQPTNYQKKTFTFYIHKVVCFPFIKFFQPEKMDLVVPQGWPSKSL